jgi:hypothetical protein
VRQLSVCRSQTLADEVFEGLRLRDTNFLAVLEVPHRYRPATAGEGAPEDLVVELEGKKALILKIWVMNHSEEADAVMKKYLRAYAQHVRDLVDHPAKDYEFEWGAVDKAEMLRALPKDLYVGAFAVGALAEDMVIDLGRTPHASDFLILGTDMLEDCVILERATEKRIQHGAVKQHLLRDEVRGPLKKIVIRVDGAAFGGVAEER